MGEVDCANRVVLTNAFSIFLQIMANHMVHRSVGTPLLVSPWGRLPSCPCLERQIDYLVTMSNIPALVRKRMSEGGIPDRNVPGPPKKLMS